MQIQTELDAGDVGHFLVDNEIVLKHVEMVRATQSCRYAGASPDPAEVEYAIELGDGTEGLTWVPEKRAARTKPDLLKKL